MGLRKTERSNARKLNLSVDEGTKGLREGRHPFQAILQSTLRALRVFGDMFDSGTEASPIGSSVNGYDAGAVRFGTGPSMRGISRGT